MNRPSSIHRSAAFAFAVAACATSSPKATDPDEQTEYVVTARGNARPDPGDELICEYERPVGSMIAERKCRSKRELDQARDEAQQLLHRVRGSPGATP